MRHQCNSDPTTQENSNIDLVVASLSGQVQPFMVSHLLTSNSEYQKESFGKFVPSDNEILLLGESTHGTEEYYQVRQQLTMHLIESRGYRVVFIEAEWPDVFYVNQYITNADPRIGSAAEALSHIQGMSLLVNALESFWLGSGKHMWQNQVIIDLVEWMKEFNKRANYSLEKMAYVFGTCWRAEFNLYCCCACSFLRN